MEREEVDKAEEKKEDQNIKGDLIQLAGSALKILYGPVIGPRNRMISRQISQRTVACLKFRLKASQKSRKTRPVSLSSSYTNCSVQVYSAASEAPIVKTGREKSTNMRLQITMSANLLRAVISGPSESKSFILPTSDTETESGVPDDGTPKECVFG